MVEPGHDLDHTELRAQAGEKRIAELCREARAFDFHAVCVNGVHARFAAAHLAGGRPPLELYAEELREAQNALSSITGEFTADDLLGVIFSRFCIGK